MQDSNLKLRHCQTLKTTTDSKISKAWKTKKKRKMMRKKEMAVTMAARKTIQRARMKSRLLLQITLDVSFMTFFDAFAAHKRTHSCP
jgi:hypothetical protein